MYVVRRGERFWFRKAIPVDVVDVLGIDEVRRSLRTSNFREARRRALEVLVRIEDVYEVLRSERPLCPARDVALRLLENALDTNFGTTGSTDPRQRLLNDAATFLRRTGDGDASVGSRWDPSDEFGAHPGIVQVTAEEALHVMKGEKPRGDENRIAVAILEAVARMASGYAKKALVYPTSQFLLARCQASPMAVGVNDKITQAAQRLNPAPVWNKAAIEARQNWIALAAVEVRSLGRLRSNRAILGLPFGKPTTPQPNRATCYRFTT